MTYILYSATRDKVFELLGAIKNDRCVGFLTLSILGPPYYSTGLGGFIYMREKDEELVDLLYDKTLEFGKKHNLKYWVFNSFERKVAEHFSKKGAALGLKTVKKGYVYSGIREL